MADRILDPLQWNVKIINPDFTPTDFFIRWLLQHSNLIQDSVPTSRLIDTTAPLTGGGDLSEDRTLGMAQSAVTPGSYTNASITVDEFGLIQAAASGGGGGGGLTAIGSVVVVAPVANISFTAIPATFKDLILAMYGRSDAAVASTTPLMRLNNDTGANYDYDRQNRFGSSTASAATSADLGGSLPGTTSAAGLAGSSEATILNYAGTVLEKSWFGSAFTDVNTNTPVANYLGGTWHDVSAIDQIDVFPGAGNWAIGSVVTLYGRG